MVRPLWARPLVANRTLFVGTSLLDLMRRACNQLDVWKESALVLGLDRTLPVDNVSDSNDSIIQSSTDYNPRKWFPSMDRGCLSVDLPPLIRRIPEPTSMSRWKSKKCY